MIEPVMLNGFSWVLAIPALAALAVFLVGVIAFIVWIYSTAARRSHGNPTLSTLLVFVAIGVWIVLISVMTSFGFGIILTIYLVAIACFGWILYRGVAVLWKAI
jgi:hypothetical protein